MEMETCTRKDDRLRQALLEKGVQVGPITGTTRSLYENRLRRLLLAEQGGTGSSEPRPQAQPRNSAHQSSHSSTPPPSSSPPPPPPPPSLEDNQLTPASDSVVQDLTLQLNNPHHAASDTAIIFPREGEVVYVCRGVLAIRCACMTHLLYNLEEPFQISVVTLTGSTSHLMVRPSELGVDLKLKVSLQLPGCFPWGFRLLFNQAEIVNELRLDEQKITPGSNVYLVLIEGATPPPNAVSVNARYFWPTLSVSHLTLGLGQLTEAVPCIHQPGPSVTKQIMLPVQIQHIVFVHDVPSLPMKLLLGFLYTGQLLLADVSAQVNNALSFGLCAILAQYFRTDMTEMCLRAVQEELAKDNTSAELLALLGRRTGFQALLVAVS